MVVALLSRICAVCVLFAMLGCNSSREDTVLTSAVLPDLRRAVCFGRHLIDLPQELPIDGEVDLIYGLDRNFKIIKAAVLPTEGPHRTLQSIVDSKVSELTSTYDADTPNKNMLAETRRIDKDLTLIVGHKEPTMMGYYQVFVIARIGGAVGMFTGDVFNRDRLNDIETNVLNVAKHTRYMPDAQQSKGTCVGPFIIDAGQDGERFAWGTRSTEHTDLTLEITVNSLLAETDGGLLKRVQSKAGMLTALGSTGSTVRSGKVTIAGRVAEELVNEEQTEGKTMRLFVAETLLNSPSTKAEPRIHIEMSLGGQVQTGSNQSTLVDPSIARSESLALWDAIVKSIRLRPGST